MYKYIPDNIFIGRNCLAQNSGLLNLGKKALIVTGANSALKSGAQTDVVRALEGLGIEWIVYNKIGENPLVSVCYEGGRIAAESGCDFVIGIGGGSPIDAAKAIAAYAANPKIAPSDVFGALENALLPIIAVPTTAGTGSEANPYGVLTIDETNTKKTFKDKASYPQYAFVDPRYLTSLSPYYLISCALDAICHCIESYLSPKSNPCSEEAALEGAAILYRALMELRNSPLNDALADELMYGATLGGVAIDVTGTGFPHPCGYNITLNEGVPHGRATAAFTGIFLDMNEEVAPERCARLYKAIGAAGDEIKSSITAMAEVSCESSEEKWARYKANISIAGNFQNSLRKVGEDEIIGIYRKVFPNK